MIDPFKTDDIFKGARVDDFKKENAALKSRIKELEGELEAEREVVDFYAEGELPYDLEIRPEKKDLWSIPEKWSQRSMSDHYCGKRARARQKDRRAYGRDFENKEG